MSISTILVSGSDTEFCLVVGNQWDNLNIQKDPPNLERFPNDAFFLQDHTQPDMSDQLRNIQLFRFNSSNGSLTSVIQLNTYVRNNGDPSQALFRNDGTKLAVSLWEITRFGTMHPLLSEIHSSRVYIYDSNGTISNERFFEEEGISGTIGIDWAPSSNSILYATNFNTTVAKTDNSLAFCLIMVLQLQNQETLRLVMKTILMKLAGPK